MKEMRAWVLKWLMEVYGKMDDLEERIHKLESMSAYNPPGYSRLLIAEILATYFDMQELAGLAFNIDLEPDSIVGSTREERARNLIAYCERRGKVRDLLLECERQRPHVNWPKAPTL